jgi:phenylpyruvate tautomerase PptA (4-oxalocrotonate tautomerase family)
MIELTLPEGALPQPALSALVERLTRTVLETEGMADNELVASTIWTFVDERPAHAINVAGRPAEQPRYRVSITVAEGSLDDERKAALVAEVTSHVLAAEGRENDPRHAARVWCHIHELPDGNWGAVGKIWRLSDIEEFAGIERAR